MSECVRAGGIGREDSPLQSSESSVFVKENHNRKKNKQLFNKFMFT